MNAEEGVQEREREREGEHIHLVGRKLNGWSESQHELQFQREQTFQRLSLHLLLCVSGATDFSFC